jgi:hypothetical protein
LLRQVAKELFRIVATQGFYPDRLVGADYIERFALTLDQGLVTAVKYLAALLKLMLLLCKKKSVTFGYGL